MNKNRRKILADDEHMEEILDFQCNGECGGRCDCKYADKCEENGCMYQTTEASSTQGKKKMKFES